MKQVVIEIPDNKFNFFMELVNNLGFTKVKQISKEQQQFVADLQHSLQQVEQHLRGEIKLKTADQLLDEL